MSVGGRLLDETGDAGRTAPERPRRRHRVLGVIGAIVVLLVVAEFCVRLIDNRLPPPLRWHSYETQRKAELVDHLAESGGADLVFAGTSLVNAGIDPVVVTSAIGRPMVAFNAALSSGVPDLMEPWLLNVVVPKLHPKVVVIGLDSFDVTDVGFAFPDAYKTSPGARRAAGKDDVLEKVDWWLTDHSDLWADRFSLRDPSTLFDAVRNKPPQLDEVATRIDASGRVTFGEDLQFSATRVVPQVQQWAVGTRNLSALGRLITGIEATGAQVVLLSMPVTDVYIAQHPHGAADYDTFDNVLRDVGARQNASVLLFDQPRDHSQFADAVHLNGGGAQRFSTELGQALQPIVGNG